MNKTDWNERMVKKSFLGDSSSSMQTEGAWNEGGKGPSVYDVREATKHTSDWKHGIDRYHRYEEDLDLLQEMGMNFYRFKLLGRESIRWEMASSMKRGYSFMIAILMRCWHGISSLCCVYNHFDMPLNLAENYEGFMSKHVIDAFVEVWEDGSRQI